MWFAALVACWAVGVLAECFLGVLACWMAVLLDLWLLGLIGLLAL